MSKLRNRARNSGGVFSPLVFRQALRLEQIAWSDLQESASEVVFVAKSAQKLFRLDTLCPNFDTWLELEASGGTVERDELGLVSGEVGRTRSLPAPKDFAKTAAIESAAEVVRRLADDSATAALPLAALTFGSTLMQRLYGEAQTEGILQVLRTGSTNRDAQEAAEYAREVTLEIATRYLEAGAAGLLLLHEDNAPDLPELPIFAALFNLTAYYDVPAVLMCRRDVDTEGVAAIQRGAADFYVTPFHQSVSIVPLKAALDGATSRGAGWLGLSRWEVDPLLDPDIIHGMRRHLFDA